MLSKLERVCFTFRDPMSDDPSPESESDGALDLSDLNFGPAWAREPSDSKNLKKYKDRGDRDDRKDRRGGGRDGHRGGGGGRDQREGRGFRGQKGGGSGRRQDDRRKPREEVEPPDGVSLQLMPAEESLDLLAKRVIDSGQTYSVFDLAKVLLQSRDRFRATFEAPEKKLFRCRKDDSIWLSREEALRHLWRGDWLENFYEKVEVEGEAPKGSFSAVARCGLSNQLLGPPNYHGYQEKLAALHRERFSNMSFGAYKAKVRMEHGEEAVEGWLESMKTVTKWKVAAPKQDEQEDSTDTTTPVATDEKLASEEISGEKTPDQPEATVEVAPEQPGGTAPEALNEPLAEDGAPTADAGTSEKEEKEVVAEPASEGMPPTESSEEAELFDDARAVERHFAEHHFDEVFEQTERAWVTGDIPGNLLSPGLLTLLKRSVAEEKRYPAKLMPIVCRQLSGRQVAVFKWNKKLKVGPSRPHAIPADTTLAERPQAMIDHLGRHSGTTLKEFWSAVMPAGVNAEQKHEWLQDFQWLLGEGHIILLADTTVHLAKLGDKKADRPKPAGEKEMRETKALVSSDDAPQGPSKALQAVDHSPPQENGKEGENEGEEEKKPETGSSS